jgi:hypothetical protein
MALSPRFQLDDILGNEVVDFAVLQANNDKLDVAAANQSLANVFTNVQTIHRAAVGNPALQVRLTADGTPRLAINADGSLNWGPSSLQVASGVMTIGSAALRAPSLQVAAGAAATPSLSFSTDPDTGIFSGGADILALAVGGVETNRINNQGEIRFNRTNARIAAGTGDDPATPGERLVQINALTITPGRLFAASLAVAGTSAHTGAATFAAGVNVTGNSVFNQSLQVAGDLNAYGGRVNFEGSNVVYIQWRGDLGALYIPYGNGIYTTAGTFTGVLSTSSDLRASGRLIVGGYDAGWTANFAANAITAGRFYQQNNAGAYCLDITDASVSYNAANKIVQRDGAGGIQCAGLYIPTGAQGGKPTHVMGQTGDGNARWWPASAVGPPASPVTLAQGWTCTVDYPDFGQQVSAFGVDRTGYWLIVMRGQLGTGHGGGHYYRLDIDGVGGSVDTGMSDAGGDESLTASVGLRYGPVLIGPGNVIRTYANKAEGSFTGTTYAYFMPTSSYNG